MSKQSAEKLLFYKERKKTREIQFYILPLLNSRTFQGFAEYCLQIKDISGLFRISFFFKDIPGIPGAVRTLIKSHISRLEISGIASQFAT
jgi:hypothetical protein